jgi:hypothetical protein
MNDRTHKVMYQVFVTLKSGEQKPIGPRVSEKGFVEQLAFSINKSVADGHLHGWADATVVTIIREDQ